MLTLSLAGGYQLAKRCLQKTGMFHGELLPLAYPSSLQSNQEIGTGHTQKRNIVNHWEHGSTISDCGWVTVRPNPDKLCKGSSRQGSNLLRGHRLSHDQVSTSTGHCQSARQGLRWAEELWLVTGLQGTGCQEVREHKGWSWVKNSGPAPLQENMRIFRVKQLRLVYVVEKPKPLFKAKVLPSWLCRELS